MTDILTQLNPAAWSAIIVLIALSFLGVIILRLIKAGKAKNPGDLVKVARERAAASKAGKAAMKQAEAAIAEPIASSRLSRIGARGDYAEPVSEVVESVEAEAEPLAEAAEPVEARVEPTKALEVTIDYSPAVEAHVPVIAEEALTDDQSTEFAHKEFADEWVTDEAEADDEQDDEPAHATAQFDFADPAHHPQNWDELVAVINVLDQAIRRPWTEDLLTLQLSKDQLAASAAGDEAMTLALSRQLAATDLARTINSAAREQAAEVVAVVREFAHQAPFSADECAAVMGGLGEIEWMALIHRGDMLEKRTLPLTVSDPEAPLWVEAARVAADQLRRDIAA
ncbi:MAG: hypothetical protein HC788_08295 [Sphingopyxis sp.]|nr:hypothetical protein [Sphingopyxis sp.]